MYSLIQLLQKWLKQTSLKRSKLPLFLQPFLIFEIAHFPLSKETHFLVLAGWAENHRLKKSTKNREQTTVNMLSI